MIKRDLLSQKYDEINSERSNYVMLIVVILLCLMLLWTRNLWLTCVEVNGDSMNDTLITGDFVLINKLDSVDRGDVVVFTTDKSYIKRVIAIGGDTVKIADGGVWIKQSGETEFKELFEEYAKGATYARYFPAGDGVELKVREGYIYALGDNRAVSRDSRYFGEVPLSSVQGTVSQFVIDYRYTVLGKLYRYL